MIVKLKIPAHVKFEGPVIVVLGCWESYVQLRMVQTCAILRGKSKLSQPYLRYLFTLFAGGICQPIEAYTKASRSLKIHT